MTEQEEFEFRARLEAEQEAAAAPRGPLKLTRAGPSGGDSTFKRSLAGAALGVADIGNTALNVLTSPLARLSPAVAQWNRTRNADFDALTEQNKDSTAFNVSRVGANVGATLPVGGALASALARAPRLAASAPALLNAVRSGGFVTGSAPAATLAGRAADMGVRAIGGGITGGASAALVNPDDALAGGVIGAALPGVARLGGNVGSRLRQYAESGAERLMQSSIKPTIRQLQNGDAATAVRTLLDYGISPNMAGVGKLRDLIDNLNSQISDRIINSGATIDKSKVVDRLNDVKGIFGNQVNPSADLAAIDSVADDFLAHPLHPGAVLPVQAAQKLKQGTYKTLSKKYGQMGSAEVEAQKGLARGLKEEIAEAVPEIAGLNAAEAKLLTTLKVAERRALMELNKNPMGLAALATNPSSWAAFMADRSSTFKALAARMVNRSAGTAESAGQMLNRGFSNPAIRNAATLSVSSSRHE